MVAINILQLGNPLNPKKGNYRRESIITNPKKTVEGQIPTLKIRITLLLTWVSSLLLHDLYNLLCKPTDLYFYCEVYYRLYHKVYYSLDVSFVLQLIGFEVTILSILPFVIANPNAAKVTIDPNHTKQHPTKKHIPMTQNPLMA